MARVDGEIVILRPVEEVFDFVADERNEPRYVLPWIRREPGYSPPMVRSELFSVGPIGLGARFLAELETRGRTIPMVVEFTGYERP